MTGPGLPEQDQRGRIRVWDLPVRLVHWSLVLLIPFQWWTAEEGRLDLHIVGGTIILGLLVFRILWGVFGSSTARFSRFVKGPSTILAHLRGRLVPAAGHSPIGALSVIAMLAILTLQVGLGLLASDEDGIEGGPLSHLVDFEVADAMSDRHETLFDFLLILIGLHIAAILYYALRRKNLVGPMVTGRRAAKVSMAAMEPASAWRFWLAAAVAAGFAAWIGAGAPV